MSTCNKRGLYENANKFNNLVQSLKPPFYFIRVGYSGYHGDHQYIVYKRLTSEMLICMLYFILIGLILVEMLKINLM